MTPSPITREPIRHDLKARRVRVADVQHVTTHLIRVTFESENLLDFVSAGPTDHVKLVIPNEHDYAPEPIVREDRLVRPYDGILRDYTPRWYSTAMRPPQLMIDFFDHVEAGPAAAWARRVRPGEVTWILGPRGSKPVPNGAESLLLFADETALPSVARWIEMSPGLAITAHLIARGGDRAYLDYLPGAADPGLAATPTAPGAPRLIWHDDGDALLAAARTISVVARDTFVWAGGEAMLLAQLRRHLTPLCDREQVAFEGYWRSGESNYDHHQPLPD